MSESFIAEWAKAQQLKAPSMKNAAVFYRNLEEELDLRRATHSCLMLHKNECVFDFSSTDTLSLSSSGLMRTAFLDELARRPDFQLSSHGSRLAGGNSELLESLERDIADFHGAESAIIVGSGGLGNSAIFSAIPRPGDVIIYDELIHATVHDGMKGSLALCQMSFRHNSVDSFADTLDAVRNSQPQIRNGSRSVIIAVESVYSMDGDICPLEDLIEIAQRLFPDGNAQFVIDEAHSTGVIGPNGAGLVCALGLQKDVAIRLHTFGKALAASGAVILCNDTVRTMLINHARPILFSVAPNFPMMAGIRATYNLLKTGQTQQAQNRVQYVVKLFLEKLTSHPTWDQANNAGLLRIPLYDDEGWNAQPFVTQILPIWTRPRHNYFLAFHLHFAGFSAFPISFPVVPKGANRVRLSFHASNSDAEVEALVTSIFAWAGEMLDIEKGDDRLRLPAAARQVYALMAQA